MKQISPFRWIPSLYFAEGFPYVIVMTIAVVMYKRLGLSNTDIAMYTSWLYLPWVIKPFWSPIVDIIRTKRWWIITMQLLVGAALAGVAFTLHIPYMVQWSLCFFWLMAFSSATHDIAADGFYILALNEHEQALHVGIRSTFYRIATIMGQGALVMGAGFLENITSRPQLAWSLTLLFAAIVMLLFAAWHSKVLPQPDYTTEDTNMCFDEAHIENSSQREKFVIIIRDFFDIFSDFMCKPQIVVAIIFLLTYRLPEALLVKITPLFLLDSVESGGLALSTAELGMVQGTVGVIGLILGGILGGAAVARHGFQKWLWPMVLAMSVPNALYVLLAFYQPTIMWFFTPDFEVTKLWIVSISYFIEQFGYGFGFTAYMLFMLYFSRGVNSTAHYAFCTGLMALSMMIPGWFAGALQERIGYYHFFFVVMALVPFTFLAASIIHVDKGFGVKKK